LEHPLKKPLAGLVLIAAVLGHLAAPAGAAVPKKERPKRTVDCNDGSGKTARVWYTVKSRHTMTRLAADNPCDKWLGIVWNRPGAGSENGSSILLVAPRTHFHRHVNFQINDGVGARIDERWQLCNGSWFSSWYVLPNEKGRIRDASEAPSAWCEGMN
jgi:hypothetical protein